MNKMTREEFEKLVNEGISSIPEKFLKRLENIDIVIEERPTNDQLKKVNIQNPFCLFGLYEGIPKTKRGSSYGMVLPDKITIFKEAIERSARNDEEIKEIVKNTVWHEIAHHFGMNEKEVREKEIKKH